MSALPKADLQPPSKPPSQRPVFRRVREMRTTIVWIMLFLLLYVVGRFLPEGFNWRLDFSRGVLPSWWVPWARPLISLLNLPLVFSLTVTAIAMRCYQRSKSFLPVLLAVLSLPTYGSSFWARWLDFLLPGCFASHGQFLLSFSNLSLRPSPCFRGGSGSSPLACGCCCPWQSGDHGLLTSSSSSPQNGRQCIHRTSASFRGASSLRRR